MPTSIEWVRNPDGTKGETWNPVTGCTKISTGCRNCYAERMSKRLAGRFGYPAAPHNFDVTLHPDKLTQPLRWRKPRRVFVCSMGDLFHEDVPVEWIRQVMYMPVCTSQHTYMFLTKRPARMHDTLDWVFAGEHPPKNIWLGVTIEKPEYSYRADYLRQCPAAVRFLSLEPLLGSFAGYPGVLDDMDLVIAGAETGPDARPMNLNWARSLRNQCQEAGIPFFFKRDSNGSRLLDGREWNECPARRGERR